MQFPRLIMVGAAILWLLLGFVDWACAKNRYSNKPTNQQVQYDPEVLKIHQKRFGKSEIGDRYLKTYEGSPKMVGTKVGKELSNVDQILEMPILPKTVGGFPYYHKFKWGKQPTLIEQLQPARRGPVENPSTKTSISQQ